MLEMWQKFKGRRLRFEKTFPEMIINSTESYCMIPLAVHEPTVCHPGSCLNCSKWYLFMSSEMMDLTVPGAAEYLGLDGVPEKLKLCSGTADKKTLAGKNVNLKTFCCRIPWEKHVSIDSKWISDMIILVVQNYPVDKLKQCICFQMNSFPKVLPTFILISIGSESLFLITPI